MSQGRSVQGWTAVVTGAASGIGAALADRLLSAGATVHGFDLDGAAVGDGIKGRSVDVADLPRYRAALAEIGSEAASGGIDLLANVAGIDEPVSALDGDGLDTYQRIMAVDYWAPVTGTLAVMPGMVDRGRGIVVNVSSDSVRTPVAGIAAYAGAKGALSAFTESIGHEVRPLGVVVQVVYPGFLLTPMGDAAIASGLPLPPKSARRTPEQVADLVMRHMGGGRAEINAVGLTVIPPVLRAAAPRLYQRIVRSRGRAAHPASNATR